MRTKVDLHWPVAGVDRSVSYQKQAPYTTPDSLNCRTEDTPEYRERGGSRPGLGLALRSELPGPVRMLARVSVNRATWQWAYVPYRGSQLSELFATPPWNNPPIFENEQGAGFNGDYSYWHGTDWGIEYPMDSLVAFDSSKPYEFSMFLRPSTKTFQLRGQVSIFVGMSASTPDPRRDSVECVLTLTDTGYECKVIEWSGGAVWQQTVPLTSNDSIDQPGSFSVRVTPFTRKVEVFFRRTAVATLTAGTLVGTRCTAWVTSGNDEIEVIKATLDYTHDESKIRENKSLRRDLLVAVSEGNLYAEDSASNLGLVKSDALQADVELSAADFEGKLFIADYGASVQGEGTGIIAVNNTVQAPGKDFVALGVTPDYSIELRDSNYSQDEKQVISIYNADSGTYRLGFRGAWTVPLAAMTQGSGVQSALESLSTIGLNNVTVTGSGGGPHTVRFLNDLAGQEMELIGTQAQNLVDSVNGLTPAMDVLEIQRGAGGDYIRGVYSISAVAGDLVMFQPDLVLSPDWSGPISDVTFGVVRSPQVFDPHTGQVIVHAASKGTVPAGCRLVASYNGRIVYAGNTVDPHVWYMSRQGDPYDWDYSQEDGGSAMYAQPSQAGRIADPITALVPHGDECLIIGCYNSLWIIRGDPGFGGTQTQLSLKIGMVSAHAYCKTPDDMCVFLTTDGLYVMPAGCHGMPTSLSRERLPNELLGLSPERELVVLEYDTQHRGIHIYITRHDATSASHWWYDWEASSFWRVKLDTDHEPFSLFERTAWDDQPVVLLGCRDGLIRSFNRDYETDDGVEFESYCMLGPVILGRHGYADGMVTELQSTLGAVSGPIQWDVQVGLGAEAAVAATARETGTWTKPGLTNTSHPRARGVAGVVKVSGLGARRWFLERVTAGINSLGLRRTR